MSRRIYLASSWRNKEQPKVVHLLRSWGHDVYDFRHPAPGNDGFSWSQAEGDWESWSSEQYVNCLENSPICRSGFAHDKGAMEWADTGVMLLPCGSSAHIETGWLAGRGKPTAALIRPTAKFNKPELMHMLVDRRFCFIASLKSWLDSLPTSTCWASGYCG